MFSLEQEEIFSRFKHPEHAGNLPKPHFQVDGSNPFCGDEVHLEGQLDQEGKINQLVHQCRACAICTASADFLCELAPKKTLNEIQQIDPDHIKQRLGIPLSATRLKCALLPLETLKQAQIKGSVWPG